MIIKTNGFLEEYYEKTKKGEIIIGQELKTELKTLIDDMQGEDYLYDTTNADIRIDFIENCVRLTKSPFYGQPMVLMLFQKAFISALYGFKMNNGDDRFKKAIFLIARKNGKALDLETRIPTPDGDKKMRDIKKGDYVFDENGKPTRVLATSEIFKDHVCYKVTFEDGEEIVCDEGHKWTVQTKGTRRRAIYVPISDRGSRAKHNLDEFACETLQTFEMVKNFKRERRDGKGVEYKYRVPIPKAIEYPKKELFSPYMLGLWLGDGDKKDNRITTSKDDLPTLVGEIIKEGFEIVSIKEFSGRLEVRFGLPEGEKHVRNYLRDMGVWKNKHIPEEYFFGSIEQRADLLCGLMDTDGTVSKAGQCSFTQKSERVTKDFGRLLASLGIKYTVRKKIAKCNEKECEAFETQFWTDKSFPCFRYQRKIDRLKEKLAPRMNYKSIINIERVLSREVKCIKVDNPRGLFLCGERNTVTHNSELCSALGLAEFILGNDGSDIVCSSNDDTQASILYDAIDLMRQMIDPKDLDTKRNQRFILNKVSNTKIFKMSERTRNKEGRNIDFAFQDESHELRSNTIPKAIEQSQSLKKNPKFVNLTTEGFVVDGYLDEELKAARKIIKGEDDGVSASRVLPWLYTQDSEIEIFQNPKSWAKSNPTLGVVKRVDYLEEQVDLAKKSKADRIFVLSKDFNMKQNGVEAWLNIEDFTYSAKYDLEDLRGGYCLGHVDLAETTDLCCAKALVMKPNDPTKYIISQYFIPQSKLDPENDDHNAGAHYKEWAEQGYITICEGNDIDLTIVADWFFTLQKKHGIALFKCGYDQRFAKDWLRRMEEYNWTKQYGDVEMILQDAKTLNNAIRLVETDLKTQLINYNENPVDRWCFKNSSLKINDFRQALIIKTENAKKIDGSVALASLYELYRRYRSDYKRLIGG